MSHLSRFSIATRFSLIGTACLLVGCASTAPHQAGDPRSPSAAVQPGVSDGAPLDHLRMARAALARGDADSARQAGQRLVLADPRSAQAHLLLAAAHHLAGDPASLDQALTGYGAARQLGGDNAWAPLLAGLAAMQRNQSEQALEQFAAAALANPDDVLAFEGLAAAAYAEGRLPLAQAAAQRALNLQAQSQPAWRMATLVAAASGQAERVNTLLRHPPAAAPADERLWLAQRSQTLLRTASVDANVAAGGASNAAAAAAPAAPSAFEAANQITVDVTMILADDRRSKAYGVNLLDGLTSIFSAGRQGSFTSTGSDSGYTGTTTLTRAISLPALTYNLNIFNQGNRNYELLARPSLTAYQGQESTFFVGEQLAVQVAGVNSSSLEKLDVGVSLKLTPSEIRADGATFKVVADRSFFSDQPIGSFQQGIATFKQSVAATADVRFGQTLILSGLTESVTDGSSSRVPVLGDIPGPDVLFSRQTQIKRERSVLILVTPSRPLGLARGRGGAAAPALDKLLKLWDEVLEPRTGTDALARRIERTPSFSRAAQGDTYVRSLADPQVLGVMLAGLR